MPNDPFDWQGHRGCRGLLPENTVPAFLRALGYPAVRTLELDVVVSADDRVIVSHDPWMDPELCQHPDGRPVGPDERLSLRRLTAREIAAFDCGQRPQARFPDRARRPAAKPTLQAVFAAVDRYCLQLTRPAPYYNIELKYRSDWEPEYVPGRERFVELVLADLRTWGRPELVTLQCFDPPVLAIVRREFPALRLSYLDERPGDLASKFAALGFVPEVYSPEESAVNATLVAEANELGTCVIPWTVNDPARMRELRACGVAGLITDYPDRIAEVLDDP